MSGSKNKRHYRTRLNEVMAVMDTTKARFVLVAAAVVLGVVYLWLVNSSATAGFYLSDLEGQVVALQQDYEKLEIELAAVQSVERIEKSAEEMQLVASSGVRYVDISSAVALNE